MKNVFNKIWFRISAWVIICILAGLGVAQLPSEDSFSGDGEFIGVSVPDSKWFTVGDSERFVGYQTKEDPSKVQNGANPQGQNTTINNGDRISIRNMGYEVFPSSTLLTSDNRITSLQTFRKRSGENILIREAITSLEWYDENQDVWENLASGFATDTEFGFAEYNINTEQRSYIYFGNGINTTSRWTGAHTNLNGVVAALDATITVDDTTGFSTTGTLRFCSTDVTYTGLTATTFTGLSGTPACADNRGVAQAIDPQVNTPRGNILLVANNRLFISGVQATPQAVFFSFYGDATSFVTSSLVTDGTAESSGIFNLGEGGGGVTAMIQDEGSTYIFKKTIIYKVTLSDSFYTLSPLKPFDGKSQTTGAVNQKSTFAGGNGVFFITPDNQIMNLTRIDGVDYPQILPISDIIKPTVDSLVFASSTGIFWKDKAYISAKTDSNSTANDVVFVYNFRMKAWESPIVGWNVGDFAIYSNGTDEDLYFGDSLNPNTFKITEEPVDGGLGVTANWRSKQYDFGLPESLKEVDSVFVEGYISDNTTLTISLLLDENGNKQIYTTDFLGTETDYLYDSPSYNVFGLQPFGTERFGSNDAFNNRKKFRIYLNKDMRRTPFYSAQLEFASDGENQGWEVTRYGFLVRESDQPEDRAIYRSFR